MKLRSTRVLRGVKPQIDSDIKNQDCSSKKRLLLRSGKSISNNKRANKADIWACVDNSVENCEIGVKETVNSDDKGLFLGSEVLDPIKDSVVSCFKQEVEEEQGNKLMSVNLESETYADDSTVINGERMLMRCKNKRGRKRKNVMGLGSDCNGEGRAKKEKVENDRVWVIGGKVLRSTTLTGATTVVDGGVKSMQKRRGRPRKFQGDVTPIPLIEVPWKKTKRHGSPSKVSHEIPVGPMKSKGIKPKLNVKDTTLKKFKRRGRPPKMEAETLATHVMKMRMKKLVSVKKDLKVRKKDDENQNSEPLVEKVDNDRKGIIVGSLERRLLKQSVRDKISDILLKCGWTIDFRQRQEKTYKDSVYIEPKGKRTHWSITRAYAKLKNKIETGNADNVEISAFTPIPEEELSLLYRHQEKVRKDKNQKRIKGKIVTYKKKKEGSKRKMLFKPRILAHDSENGSKQGNEGVLVIKKRNLLSWMIDLGVISVGMKVRYGKTRRQTRSIEGIITSDGIRCGCCNEIIGVSAFVAHCGGKTGQVFDNLYFESGKCLRNCLMDSWKKEEESNINRFNVVDVHGDDPNDDTCNICGDGGNLICCDGCPSTFHQSCLDIQNFPSGEWNCIYCTCKFCGVVSVNNPQVEDSHDAVTSQILSCCLCEEKFHQSCLQEVEAEYTDYNRLPFCGRKCQELFERLQTYLGVKHELEDGLSWTLLQRSDVDQDLNVHDTRLKVEHNSKLAVAFSVMDECFAPIVDERSGTSIIHDVVYNCGSNFRRLNYAGFLTAVLEKGDEFISAATIRIHGYQLAEMPFIGTRHMYRRQGMCRRLLDAIERTLSSLGVEELIIPAIPALMQTWTTAFGFTPLEESKKQAMKRMSMLVFPGIVMLKKHLLQFQSRDADHSPFAGVEKDVIDPEPKDENNPQLEATSSNAIDYDQTPTRTAGISYEQTEEATVGKKVIDDKITASNGVNGLCDLNLPVKNDFPCDTDAQTSVDSELFHDCTADPCSTDSVVCGNHQSPELTLDVENDGVPGVKVKPSPLTSILAFKNTFDLNLHPTAVETDVHIVSDDSTDSKTCESQPFGIL
ncbi:putative histone acetyltransferase chromatin regulator PHD family [Helianthus annuus]|nr:putative histone acetyltransferase chromatin regulator PHD family [Helianthus annuus]